MLYPLAGFFFGLIWLGSELSHRKAHGLHPATLGAAYRLGQKKKKSEDTRVSAAIFATLTTFIFAVWESVMRFLVDRENFFWIFLAGLALAVVAFWRRNKTFGRPAAMGQVTRLDVGLFVLSTMLLTGSLFSLIFCPWVYWRTRWLARA